MSATYTLLFFLHFVCQKMELHGIIPRRGMLKPEPYGRIVKRRGCRTSLIKNNLVRRPVLRLASSQQFKSTIQASNSSQQSKPTIQVNNPSQQFKSAIQVYNSLNTAEPRISTAPIMPAGVTGSRSRRAERNRATTGSM